MDPIPHLGKVNVTLELKLEVLMAMMMEEKDKDLQIDCIWVVFSQHDHQSQELEGQPVQMDTVSIIATFPAELREEVQPIVWIFCAFCIHVSLDLIIATIS